MDIFLRKAGNLDFIFNELKSKKSQFMMSLLSHEEGFDYLTNRKNWTLPELEKWMKTENIKYV
jgi:hypothetical protein